ncbi:hypothetical protein [Aggregatibacter aphrophilus]|uniref:hypothetical protein n=1 Tax=Aggregatibacter aphrophilus TaxID=732 RepID=UPI0028F01D74|nr:hypothetical protein [Aggregatibacter aphrophilus]
MMKKLLGMTVLSMILAACSQQSDRPEPPPQEPMGAQQEVMGAPQMAQNSQMEAVLKACDQKVGKTKDQAKFDACMKTKGFERAPGPQPQGAPVK